MRHLAKAARWRRAAGFTVFEFAIVAIILAILTGVLLQRLLDYQQQAELAAVQRTVAILRSALVLKTAQLRMGNDPSAVAPLAAQNPMDWLAEKPPNYLGEFFSPDLTELQDGNWLFDRKDKSLIYLLNNGKSFPGGIPKPMKFKVKLFDGTQQLPGGQSNGVVTDVSLIQVDG